MRLTHHVIATAFVVMACLNFTRADSGGNADPVQMHLENAKAVNAKAREQAGDVLRAALESAIKSADISKQADLIAQLKSQEQAFVTNGVLPNSPVVKSAVDTYRAASELADANLDRAFARAVRHYASQGDGDKALAIEQEKSRFNQQHAAATSAPDAANSTEPAVISQNLLKAKTQYKTDVNEASNKLSTKVDARLNAAMNAGDLQTAQAVQAVKDGLKNHGQIPENSTDSAIASAVVDYRHAIQSANVKMARAFSQAVHDLTRARQLDQAQAVQREYVTDELSSIDLTAVPDTGGSAGDTTYVLGRTLPEFLTTAEHWDMHPRGGIFLQRRTFIRSKNGNFLNRDFTCDIWFTTETTGTDLFIGLGEGRGRPTEALPSNSLALCITSPDENEGAVGFLRPDGQIDTIGHLTNAGDYVARLERSGNVLTLSIGDEDADGTFNPKFSTSVSDTSVIAPFITTQNAHFFFGGGRFWKIRYINGRPPTVVPDVVVKSLVRG